MQSGKAFAETHSSVYLLEDVSSRASPTKHFIRRWKTINIGLAVDREYSIHIDMNKPFTNHMGLLSKVVFCPGNRSNLRKTREIVHYLIKENTTRMST